MTTARDRGHRAARVVRAAALAGALSGAPSAVHALRTRQDPFAPTRAAGRIVRPDEHRLAPLIGAAAAVHAALSLGWTVVIAATLPRSAGPARTVLHGALVGAAIAGLDLGVAHALPHPRLAAIAELEVAPQLADHVAFGAVAGLLLIHRPGRTVS